MKIRIRLRRPGLRTSVALLAGAGLIGGAAVIAPHLATHTNIRPVDAAATCTFNYQPQTGYDLDVCISVNGSIVTPSVDVHQVGDTGSSCAIYLEVWDDAGDRLDNPASTQSLPCTVGQASGASFDAAALSGATVHKSPAGTIDAHSFARLVINGVGVYIPGQGDSPAVPVPSPSGCQPGDTEAGCQNPSAPALWCPTSDSTKPVCGETGAFQNDMPVDYGTDNNQDDLNRAVAIKAYAYTVASAMAIWSDAHDFFEHYLDGTGTDKSFDSTAAYHDSSIFSTTVNGTVKQEITQVTPSGKGSFDSGWNDFPAVNAPISLWGNPDWENALGHCFYRVTGQSQQGGTWQVRLQLTSYYQFRPGGDFHVGPLTAVKGADFRLLEQVGIAKNFRSIGDGTLTYDGQGNPSS